MFLEQSCYVTGNAEIFTNEPNFKYCHSVYFRYRTKYHKIGLRIYFLLHDDLKLFTASAVDHCQKRTTFRLKDLFIILTPLKRCVKFCDGTVPEAIRHHKYPFLDFIQSGSVKIH